MVYLDEQQRQTATKEERYQQEIQAKEPGCDGANAAEDDDSYHDVTPGPTQSETVDCETQSERVCDQPGGYDGEFGGSEIARRRNGENGR